MKIFSRMTDTIVLTAVCLFFVGCEHSLKNENLHVDTPTDGASFKVFNGKYENTALLKTRQPESIAVLPFQYFGSRETTSAVTTEYPEQTVRRAVDKQIALLPFRCLDLQTIQQRLNNDGIKDPHEIPELLRKHPERLNNLLGVDAAITGTVTRFETFHSGIDNQVFIDCELKMWDLKAGRLLWQADHTSRALRPESCTDPDVLTMSTIASLWNLQSMETLILINLLFQEIISTIDIDKNKAADSPPAPKIDLFAVMDAGTVFKAGDRIVFRLLGDPNCNAFCDLTGFKTDIRLMPADENLQQSVQEDVICAIEKKYPDIGRKVPDELLAAIRKIFAERQIYEGSCLVEPGQEAHDLTARAYLTHTETAQSAVSTLEHRINLDGCPPDRVTGLAVTSLNRKIGIEWSRPSAPDLAGYEIWMGSKPYTSDMPAARTETNRALIGNLKNFKKVYMRVRAVDKAGNTGEFSDNVVAVPLPEPGLYDLPSPGPFLEGTIEESIFLESEKSPFTVDGDLRIVEGGALICAPNVQLRFNPGAALLIEGGNLLVYGGSDAPVIFTSGTGENKPGSWEGIVLTDSRGSYLNHLTIEYAQTGLTLENTSVKITGAKISHCSRAGILLKDGSSPIITCSIFEDNKGHGAMIFEGETKTPLIKHNIFRNNFPYHVSSFATMDIDVTENFWGTPSPGTFRFLGAVSWKPFLKNRPDCSEETD